MEVEPVARQIDMVGTTCLVFVGGNVDRMNVDHPWTDAPGEKVDTEAT